MGIFLIFLLSLLTLAGAFFLCRAYLQAQPASAPDGGRFSDRARRLGPLIYAAVFALILYWLARSGAERYIGAGMLCFYAEGRALPGRFFLLCASLFVGLFLYLTPAGKRLRDKLDMLADKPWGRWVISLAFALLFLLWASRVIVFSYYTNDDGDVIESIITAANSGVAAGFSSFSHVLFCILFGALYRLAPEVRWYFGYHILALAASLAVFGRCILLKTRRLGLSTPAGLLLDLAMSFVLLYSFARLSFTVTPAVLGSAAVALVLCRSDARTRGERISLDAVSALFLLMCYLQREDSAKAVLCFWALACAYHLARLLLAGREGLKEKLIGFGAYLLAAALILFGAKAVARSDSFKRNAEYANAEYYRSLILDFLIDDITAEQLESVGISEELGVLLRGWYFMDERITTETFRALASRYYADRAEAAATGSSIAELIRDIRSDGQMYLRLMCLAALLILAVGAWIRRGRRYLPELLCALCAAGGAAILWLYLVGIGRFLIHVYLVVFTPALITALLMALSVPDDPPVMRDKRRAAAGISTVLGLAAFCVLSYACAAAAPTADIAITHDELFAEEIAVEEYVDSYPDVTFITNIYGTKLDPLHGTRYPANKRYWGAVGDTYRTDRLYADAFFRDDVRFLCQRPGYIIFLMQYLTLEYGPVQAELTRRIIDDIVVYDIDAVSPGADYTGWYEQNGFTYYFENGEAVCGTHMIDGVEYEFAPAGAAAELSLRMTDGASIYTTNAYSLLTDD